MISAFHCCLATKLCPTLVTTWTVACQDPLSMGFSRQEYWSGLPFPSPGVLPDPGIEPRSPALQADSLPTELWGKPSCYVVLICKTLGWKSLNTPILAKLLSPHSSKAIYDHLHEADGKWGDWKLFFSLYYIFGRSLSLYVCVRGNMVWYYMPQSSWPVFLSSLCYSLLV